ncbi:MAG: hypothetical protein ACE5JX_03545 [Acidobacteriota bacterium]
MSKALFLVYILYCLEVGIFLIIYPWMRLWDQNYVLAHYPQLRLILLNNFFRGAVSGLGFANLVLGAWEIVHFHQYSRKA